MNSNNNIAEFYNNSNSSLIISSNGFIGINKKSGIQERLHIDGNIKIKGTIYPESNISFDIGKDTNKIRDLYSSNISINSLIYNNNISRPIINFQINSNNFIYSSIDGGIYYYLLNIENYVKAKINASNAKCRVFKILTIGSYDWKSSRKHNINTLSYDCIPEEIQINMSNYFNNNGIDTYNDTQINYQIYGKSFRETYGYWNCIENTNNNQNFDYFNYIIFLTKNIQNLSVSITPLIFGS